MSSFLPEKCGWGVENSMMLRIRWRKVLLDLWRHKARTILVTLAIAVGVFAIGFITSAFS